MIRKEFAQDSEKTITHRRYYLTQVSCIIEEFPINCLLICDSGESPII